MAFYEKEFNMTIRDIDKDTYLTNKAILSYFEDIGGYCSNIAGYGLEQISETKISWVLLHWKIKILKQIKYGAPVRIKTWSRGPKLACCYRDFELYNSKNELCAIGTSKWALYHLEKGLMKLNSDIMSKFDVEDKIVMDFDFKKIQEPTNYISIFNYTVLRSDIDINSHMHNLRYLDLAYEALPKEVYDNNSFNYVEIMYKKECYLGDNLKCFYLYINDEHIITIKSQDEKVLHAIIKLK